MTHWLQAAVMQDETLEWMKRLLGGKQPADLIADFGAFLEKGEPGNEPTLDDIQQAMRD